MPTVQELLAANLFDVFGSRDPAARAAVAADVYAEDVAFTDPESSRTGLDALLAAAAGLIDPAPPDFAFTADGPVYVGDGTGALAWAFGPAGAPVARGVDVITVRDGRIATLLTLLSKP
jgi:SnoaL-like domain